jgi:hypothetical protein
MSEATTAQAYQESRIEDEPILGPVLAMPDGSFKRLSWLERLLVRLHLTDAKALEARYYRPQRS